MIGIVTMGPELGLKTVGDLWWRHHDLRQPCRGHRWKWAFGYHDIASQVTSMKNQTAKKVKKWTFSHWFCMSEVKKWPDLRSQLWNFRDMQTVLDLILINFCDFQTFWIKTVARVRRWLFSEVRSFSVTWWPDLTWPRVKTCTKHAQKMSG